MSLSDIFVGVPQSKLAGLTILMTLALISIFILAGKDKLAFGQKIAIVLLLVLLALPTILITLFQINCVVTGAGPRNPWCGWYAWIVAALIVIYCIMLVFVSLTSFAKGESVLAKDAALQAENVMTREFFNNMEGEDAPEEATEGFEGGQPAVDVLGGAKKLLKDGFEDGPVPKKGAAPAPPAKKPVDAFTDYPEGTVMEPEGEEIEGFQSGGYAAF